ncbi:MAG: GntR family transcriptional regulator [Acidobacteriota bacterium]
MSTVERAYQDILYRLLKGELRPGTWLRQDEIANRLGVSKIPVREALQRLAASGLVKIEPHRGAVVPSLNRADAEEVFELRLAIEPMLLERAMDKITIVDLAKAELALGDESLALTESNWLFHSALYQPAGWSRGMAIAEMLHASVAPYVELYTANLGGEGDSDAQHRALLEHCRGGRRQEAHDLLVQHIQMATVALMEFLED